jgi:hypothetical protein
MIGHILLLMVLKGSLEDLVFRVNECLRLGLLVSVIMQWIAFVHLNSN